MNSSGLILIEKYDIFLHYIYPVLQDIPKSHGIIKARAIELVFLQPELIYRAIKSDHKSRLNEADAGLASIRHQLRFLSSTRNIVNTLDKESGKPIRKIGKPLLSKKAEQVSGIHLSEVGKIIGSMLNHRGK